ncbi:hypothetical protein ABPG74_007588 [Tetrahymena malaccensis]
MNQKTRNETSLATQNSQLGIPSVSLITHDEFYGNQAKSQLDDHNPETIHYQTPNSKNSQNQRKAIDLKHKNLKILQELKEISDQLQSALERQKIQQKQNVQYSPKDVRIAEQQEEIDKAFSILNLQKRDIELLDQQVQHLINNDKRVEELNQQLIDKNKEIKALEHEKNYLNKVLGNVDKIMKAEGVKDQKLQQVHSAYKEEIRLLKERIRELENIQRQSEKNAMKLHQHYMDLDEKYKQAIQNSPSQQNKSPNKYRNSTENSHLLIESIKNDYEDKIQTYIQKLKDKENESKSLTLQLQKKDNEVRDLKVLVREYEIQVQREQRDKEMIESYNKNLREQLKIQAQKLSQESLPSIQQITQHGKEVIKIPTRQQRTQTPKKDVISPYKSTITQIRKDQKQISNSLEKNGNKMNYNNNSNYNEEIKIYKRENSSSIKKKTNGYNQHTMSMEIQHSRENTDIDLADKLNQSVLNDNQQKYSTPGTPQKKLFIKRQLRSPSINNSDSINNRYNNRSTDRRETTGSANNSNIFSSNNSNSNNKNIKKSNLFSSKLSTKDNEDLINQLHPLSARNRIKELQQSENLNNEANANKEDNKIIIETPYVKTLNSRYLALKSNQNEGKSPIKTELSTLLEKKQKTKLDQEKSPQQSQLQQSNDKKDNKSDQNQNKNNLAGQIPSDVSEQDLNHTFTQFQKEVSQVGLEKFYGDEFKDLDVHRSSPDLTSDMANKNLQKSTQFSKPKKDGLQIKQQSIGKVQPHNQIMFSDYDFITSQNHSNPVSLVKMVGARFWLFKPSNKIMGLQINYLTNQNKLIWGPANVHIFTSNITVQTMNLANNFKEGDDPDKLDFVSLIGCRYNNEYSYIENITFITNSGVVYNFGKQIADPKQPLIYFDIQSEIEVPFSLFGSISKEYDPMSGILIGTKLSYFGFQVANIDQLKQKSTQPLKSSKHVQSDGNLNPPSSQLSIQNGQDQQKQTKSNNDKQDEKCQKPNEINGQKENQNVKQSQNQNQKPATQENQIQNDQKNINQIQQQQNNHQQQQQQQPQNSSQEQILKNDAHSNLKNDNSKQSDLQSQKTATFYNQNNNTSQQTNQNTNNQNVQQKTEENNKIQTSNQAKK